MPIDPAGMHVKRPLFATRTSAGHGCDFGAAGFPFSSSDCTVKLLPSEFPATPTVIPGIV